MGITVKHCQCCFWIFFFFWRIFSLINGPSLLTEDFDNYLFLECIIWDAILLKRWLWNWARNKQKTKIWSRFGIFYFHLERIWIQKVVVWKMILLLVQIMFVERCLLCKFPFCHTDLFLQLSLGHVCPHKMKKHARIKW